MDRCWDGREGARSSKARPWGPRPRSPAALSQQFHVTAHGNWELMLFPVISAPKALCAPHPACGPWRFGSPGTTHLMSVGKALRGEVVLPLVQPMELQQKMSSWVFPATKPPSYGTRLSKIESPPLEGF